MKKYLLSSLIAIGVLLGSFGVAFSSSVFNSQQLAPNPQNGNCLTTNGANPGVNAWSTCSGGGGASTSSVQSIILPLIANGTVAGVNATSSTTSFLIQGNNTQDPLNVTTSTSGSLFYIKSSGIAAFGTSTPAASNSVTIANQASTGNTVLNVTNTASTSIAAFTLTGDTANGLISERWINSGSASTTFLNLPFSGSLRTGTDATNGLVIDNQAVGGAIRFVTGGGSFTNEHMRIDGSGNVSIGTTTATALLTLQGALGSATDLFSVASSSGSNYIQVKSGGEFNLANQTLSGNSATDNFLNITGALPATTTAVTNGLNFLITSNGSSSFAQNAMNVQLITGYTGPITTRAAFFVNNAASTGASAWTSGAANYGIVANGQPSATTTGHTVGFNGNAGNSSTLNLGSLSRSVNGANSPLLNIGAAGLSLNATTTVGGFFGLMATAPTISTSSALLVDNGVTGSNLLTAQVNGTAIDVITGTGALGINTTTPVSLLSIQGSSGLATDLLNISTSTGLSYLQVKSGGQINIANQTIGGNSQTDNFINLTDTLAATSTVIENGLNFTVNSAGNSSFAQRGFLFTFGSGYTGSAATAALRFTSAAQSTGTNGWTGGPGNRGIDGIVSGTTAGHNVGISGNASGSSSLNLSLLGFSTNATNNPLVNVGVGGLALNATTSVAGFFGLQSTAPTFATSSALIVDNAGSTGSDLFVAQNNGTAVDVINSTGSFGIGTSTPTALVSLNASTTAAGGINFGDATADLYRSSTGNIKTDAAFTANGDITTGSGGRFIFSGKTTLFANADSQLRLRNSAGTDFDLLQFGGTTSSFPAIRSASSTAPGGIALKVIGADGLTNANLYVTGSVGIGTTTPNAELHVASASATLTTLAVQATSSQTSAILDIWSAAGASLFNVGANGNLTTGGTLPTVGTGSITAGSTNTAGEVTLAAAATSITITFANSGFTNTPFCTVTQETGSPLAHTGSSTPTTLVISAATSIGLDKFTYMCIGHN